MNPTHAHLILNHFPTIGTMLGLALLVTSIIRKSVDLERASYVIFLIMAILAIPTFVTGGAAEFAIGARPDIAPAISAHKDAALLAFVFLGLTGLLAWLGLWQVRRFSRPAKWNVAGVLILSMMTMGLMVTTGTSGGEISHPEIRSIQETASAGGGGIWISIGALMRDEVWTWSASETLHFIGMAVLFGVVLLVNLRVLGVAKSVPYSAMHRLLPLGVLGFSINVVTGALFFIGDAPRYMTMPGFPPKITLMVLAGVSVLYFTVFDQVWTVEAGDDAPLIAKVVAATTILLWLGVIFFGRMLPYFGGGGTGGGG